LPHARVHAHAGGAPAFTLRVGASELPEEAAAALFTRLQRALFSATRGFPFLLFGAPSGAGGSGGEGVGGDEAEVWGEWAALPAAAAALQAHPAAACALSLRAVCAPLAALACPAATPTPSEKLRALSAALDTLLRALRFNALLRGEGAGETAGQDEILPALMLALAGLGGAARARLGALCATTLHPFVAEGWGAASFQASQMVTLQMAVEALAREGARAPRGDEGATFRCS
jgi:hypothetical protein